MRGHPGRSASTFSRHPGECRDPAFLLLVFAMASATLDPGFRRDDDICFDADRMTS